jgi:hypothetical protein
VAIVDLVDDKAGLEDDHMRDHRIVGRIRVFGDVEIFLDDTPRVGQEGPVRADTATIFVRLSDVVGTDRDKPAIANLHLTVELKKPFSLSAVFGAETAAAQELPAFRGVRRKLVDVALYSHLLIAFRRCVHCGRVAPW